MPESPDARCSRCQRPLNDGDTAFLVDFDQIDVHGQTVERSVVTELVCARCNEQ